MAEKPKPRQRRRTRAQRAKDAEAVIKDGPGPPGPRGNRYEQVQRDIEIYRASLRGLSDYDLAVTYDLDPRTVRAIVNAIQAEGPRITKANPLNVIDQTVAQLDAGISELAAEAARNKGAVRVTAVTNRLRAIFDKAKFLQSVGVLPSEAQVMRVQIDALGLAERLVDLLEQHGLLTPELRDAINTEFADVLEGAGREIEPLALEPVRSDG
jgi:hypothetical protein